MSPRNRIFALVCVCAAVLLGTAQHTLGAAASVTAVPQANGSVLATATGSFASCVVCDARNAAGQCTHSRTVTNGSIALSRDGGLFLCTAGGNSSATCASTEGRGGLHGTHAYTAMATDCTGNTASSAPLTLDNTPTVTVTAPTGVVTGPFEITGTATFTPTLSPTKGAINVYVNGAYVAYKLCPTETCTVSYQAFAGRLYELSHGGPYTVKLMASGSGASAGDQKTFSVANTTTVAVTAPTGDVTGPFEITGTATFTPTLSPTKGFINVYVNSAYVAYKVCPTETCTVSYQALAGRLYELSHGGPYTVKLVATGGGASASDQQTFTVATCKDADHDGHFAIDPVACPPPLGDDCNDHDAAIYPGAPEQCNGTDNNCNGVAGEGVCDTLGVCFSSSLNPASGGLLQRQELFATRGTGLAAHLALHYHSLDIPGGPLGAGWTHSYALTLTAMPGGSVILSHGDGTRRVYQPSGSGYRAQAGDYSTLTRASDGWTLVEKSGDMAHFALAGRIVFLADRHDNRLTFTYTQGLLTTVVDPADRTTTFTYDATQKVSMITDPVGNHHTFTYTADRLTAVTTTDTEGGTRPWAYTYDTSGRLLTKTDPNGETTRYAYDTTNKVTASTTPDGQTKAVHYDPTTATAQITAGDGGVWTYTYAPRLGLLTATTDPLGHTTRYAYDAHKHLTARTAPDGSVTRYTYDAQGNLTAMTDALGHTTTFTTNAFGQVTSITGPQGATTSFTYDGRGNLLARTDPTGATTRYVYDTRGYLTQRTDALGTLTTFTSDAAGMLTALTDPTGATTTFTTDRAGNVTHQTDALGHTTQFAYDSLSQLLQVTDPLGHGPTFTYDAAGNHLSQTDANGHLTASAANARGQQTAVYDALGGVTTYSYGPSGCAACGAGRGNPLTQVTDANGQTTRYAYDHAGRLVAETDTLGHVVTSTYDATGRPRTRTDATGATSQYTYDALGRLLSKTFPDHSTALFTDDASGNLLTATNPHISYTFTYDRTNGLTAVMDSRGVTLSYQYDAVGRRTQMTYPDGSVVSYTYDPAGRLASLTHEGKTFTYAYESTGRRASAMAPNGVGTTYAYDDTGRLTQLTHRDATGSILQHVAYTHDAVGNRTTKTDDHGSAMYTYDPLARLVETVQPLPSTPLESFTYDALGNWMDSTPNGDAQFNQGNHLLDDAHFTYQYDANGSLIRKTAKADGGVTTYAYDAENKLIQVVSSTGTTVHYTYDALGRRIEKRVVNGTTTVTQYVYDHADIVLERDGTDTITTRYTHGPGIDEPLLLTQDGQWFVYHADGLGSITALTDAAGVVQQQYTYTAFGTIVSQLDVSIVQPYTFTGREFDAETGLYFLRARTYDAATGRFLQHDPIGFAGGDMNLYGYVMNNPVNFRDPSGLAVSVCMRRAQLPFPLNYFSHMWLKTDTHEAGMGAQPGVIPGQGNSNAPYDSTQTIDHRGQSEQPGATCRRVIVDEECVNRLIAPGQPTGPWALGNTCQDFATRVLSMCTIGSPYPLLPH